MTSAEPREPQATQCRNEQKKRRLRRAGHLLADPRMTGRAIGAIAFDVGFGDLSTFNRNFRRRFGCTPTELRDAGGSAGRDAETLV